MSRVRRDGVDPAAGPPLTEPTTAGPSAEDEPPGLLRAGVITYVYSALTLAANLLSGVASARALGPSGRGVAVALTTLSQLIGFIFAMGVAQSLSLFIARAPANGPKLLSAWLVLLAPCSLAAILVGEALLPLVFSTHNAEAVATGRWFMLTVILVIAAELNYGLLLGMHDFTVYNFLRFAQPALMAGSFVVLWRLGALHVTSALVAPAAATALVLAVGMTRSIRRIGLGRPDLRLARETLWYGLRGQGTLVATHVNARLDVAMLPAYVMAAGVGLYSVATNVSLIVYQLSSTLAALLIPTAARDPRRGPERIIDALYGSLLVAAAAAIVIGVLATPLLGVIYGHSFRQAAGTLRLLLPGAVLFAGSTITSAGVYAAGRPLTASLAQVAGLVVTVVGLLVFLPTGGITAAAIVSTASYATVFVTTLIAFKHSARVPWRGLVPEPRRLRSLVDRPSPG